MTSIYKNFSAQYKNFIQIISCPTIFCGKYNYDPHFIGQLQSTLSGVGEITSGTHLWFPLLWEAEAEVSQIPT